MVVVKKNLSIFSRVLKRSESEYRSRKTTIADIFRVNEEKIILVIIHELMLADRKVSRVIIIISIEAAIIENISS